MRTTDLFLMACFSASLAAAPTSAATRPTSAALPRRAFLGAALADLTPEERTTQHVGATDAGVLVRKVFPASTAERAGIVDGDVLLAMDTTRATAPARVVQAVAKRKSGQ